MKILMILTLLMTTGCATSKKLVGTYGSKSDIWADNPDRDPLLGAVRKALSWYRDHGSLSVQSRPRSAEDGRTHMTYMVDMVQLLGLDVKSQILTAKFWENYVWFDPRINWDPEDFDNITHIVISHGKHIWAPDMVLYNEFESERSWESFPHIVNNNGDVLWVPATIYKVPCNMDTTKFPFDSHTCELTFGSWILSDEELAVTLDYKITKDRPVLVENSEWETVSQKRALETRQYPIGNFTLVNYTLTFRRRAGFFAYVLLLPAILLNLLTMILFLLPPECEDKVNLGMSLFLSYFVLLMIVVESTPKSGLTIPIIGQYLFVSLGLIATSIFVCTILYNLATKESEPGNRFSKRTMKVLNVLDRLLCLRRIILTRHSRSTRRHNGASKGFTVVASGELTDQHELPKATSTEQWQLVASIAQRVILLCFIIFNAVVLCLMLYVFLQ